jgi:hypothetical protein
MEVDGFLSEAEVAEAVAESGRAAHIESTTTMENDGVPQHRNSTQAWLGHGSALAPLLKRLNARVAELLVLPLAASDALQVRKTPSWPRNWPDFSL